MREYPKGGVIGKTVRLFRTVQEWKIPLYAANACYFMVLAMFPSLLLLLNLLRHTSMDVEGLAEMLYGIFPEALAVGAEELILLTWDSTGGALVGVSAVTALWSGSRGLYGVLKGLAAVYGVEDQRGYLRRRLISMGCLFAVLVMLLVTLGLRIGMQKIQLRFPVITVLQTVLFAAVFAVLPGNRLRDSLPGAFLAALGWQIFSDLYSVYVIRFAPLGSVYGSVYAVALSMLWLYCCMSILFYGGALNVLLTGRKREKM